MTERWREPPTVLEAEPSLGRSVRFEGDDRGEMEDFDLTLDENTVERIRLGYICVDCLEPQQTPFPEACSLCGFPMLAEQVVRFARIYRGVEVLGPSVSIADEIERVNELGPRLWLPPRRVK